MARANEDPWMKFLEKHVHGKDGPATTEVFCNGTISFYDIMYGMPGEEIYGVEVSDARRGTWVIETKYNKRTYTRSLNMHYKRYGSKMPRKDGEFLGAVDVECGTIFIDFQRGRRVLCATGGDGGFSIFGNRDSEGQIVHIYATFW